MSIFQSHDVIALLPKYEKFLHLLKMGYSTDKKSTVYEIAKGSNTNGFFFRIFI